MVIITEHTICGAKRKMEKNSQINKKKWNK